MYITSGQKTAAMVGGLLIVGAGAFVYIDPMELDLLGLNPAPVIQPAAAKKAPPRPAKTAKNTQVTQKPPAAKPMKEPAATKATALKDMLKAPSAASAMKPNASSKKGMMPKALKLPTPEQIAASIQSANSASKSTSTMKRPSDYSPNYTANTPYPPSMDVRYCLEESTPQEIAKCAGE